MIDFTSYSFKQRLMRIESNYNNCDSIDSKQYYFNYAYVLLYDVVKNYDISKTELYDYLNHSHFYKKVISSIGVKQCAIDSILNEVSDSLAQSLTHIVDDLEKNLHNELNAIRLLLTNSTNKEKNLYV